MVSPASVRRVSATRASSGSAGWQQVKISRSRSSGIAARSSPGRPVRFVGRHRATSCSLAASVAPRRSRSRARLRAVVVSQAPGRRGTPSARPAVQRLRERVLGALLGQVPVPGHPDQGGDDAAPLLRGTPRRPPPRRRRVSCRRQNGRTSIDPERWRDRVLGRDLDGLVQVGAVDDVVAGDLLLGLGERPVAEQHLAAADPYGRGVLGRAQLVTVEPDAGRVELVGPRHRLVQVGLVRHPVEHGRVDAHEQHELHRPLPLVASGVQVMVTLVSRRRVPGAGPHRHDDRRTPGWTPRAGNLAAAVRPRRRGSGCQWRAAAARPTCRSRASALEYSSWRSSIAGSYGQPAVGDVAADVDKDGP